MVCKNKNSNYRVNLTIYNVWFKEPHWLLIFTLYKQLFIRAMWQAMNPYVSMRNHFPLAP